MDIFSLILENWGIFCIVVGLIGLITALIYSYITNMNKVINNHAIFIRLFKTIVSSNKISYYDSELLDEFTPKELEDNFTDEQLKSFGIKRKGKE